MKSFFRAALAVSLTLSAMQAWATDAKNDYLILGPGSYSCARIVKDMVTDAKDKNPASTIVYSNWLAGSLTAYNRDTKGTYSILGDSSFDEAFIWTLKYCEQNPKVIYAAAIDALVHKLKPHHFASMAEASKPHQDEDKDDDDDGNDDNDGRD